MFTSFLVFFVISLCIQYSYCGSCAMYMFATSTSYRPGVDFTNKFEADAICNNLGRAANINNHGTGARGPWRAYMSTSTSDIRDELGVFEVDKICRVEGDSKILVTTTTGKLYNDAGSVDVIDQKLEKDQNNVGSGNVAVWTGSYANGTFSGRDCQGWSSSSMSKEGTKGFSDTKTRNWVDNGELTCNNGAHLYCYEVIPDPHADCRTIFITKERRQGNFGGLPEADNICRDASMHADTWPHISKPVKEGLVEYKAVFSVDGNDARDRLKMDDGGRCVKRLDGLLVSNNGLLGKTTGNTLERTILFRNDGSTYTGKVWTGSTTSLRYDTTNYVCNGDWITEEGDPWKGADGDTDEVDYRWVDDGFSWCDSNNAFYCLSMEIPPTEAPTGPPTKNPTKQPTAYPTPAPTNPTPAPVTTAAITSGDGPATSSGSSAVSTSTGDGGGSGTGTTVEMTSDDGGGSDETTTSTDDSFGVTEPKEEPMNPVLFVIFALIVVFLIIFCLLLYLVIRKRKRRRRIVNDVPVFTRGTTRSSYIDSSRNIHRVHAGGNRGSHSISRRASREDVRRAGSHEQRAEKRRSRNKVARGMHSPRTPGGSVGKNNDMPPNPLAPNPSNGVYAAAPHAPPNASVMATTMGAETTEYGRLAQVKADADNTSPQYDSVRDASTDLYGTVPQNIGGVLVEGVVGDNGQVYDKVTTPPPTAGIIYSALGANPT